MKVVILFLIFLVQNFSFASVKGKVPLIGEAQYNWFFLEVYKAKLWSNSTELNNIYKNPLALELEYLRDFKGKDIAKQSVKEIISAGVEEKYAKSWEEKLTEIFPDIKEGDKLLASYSPELGIVFYHNTKKKVGEIKDLKFSKIFLDIWLGDKASDSDFRKKLLGIK